MEEAPLQFIESWNYWGGMAAIGFMALSVLRLLIYAARLAAVKELKGKYDFINQNEIGALWQSTILLLFGVALFANSFIGEIGMFWLIIRGFVTLCIAFIVGVIVSNVLKYYYPFYVEKRLKRLRYKPRISPKSGKPMKKKKGYALGGPATPMEGEQSRYRPSANRAPQGMMSARGMTAGMGMAKGGMMKKKSYAKGGKIYANCGASVPGAHSKKKK